MSTRDSYPAGVPCWVETIQADTRAAAAFYGPLMGWRLVGSDDPDEEDSFEYLVARLHGRDVAGIASVDRQDPAWVTHVRVADAAAAGERAVAAGGAVLDGPVDADPAGRFVVLADPLGARLCAWEAGIREGAELINEPGAWAMSALQTADPERAAAFYGAVFGWEAEPYGAVHLFRLPGYVGGTEEQPVPRDVVAVMAPTGDPWVSSRWAVDFWVPDDVETVAARAVELGGRVIAPAHDRPPFRSAVLADPAGAAFSVSRLAA